MFSKQEAADLRRRFWTNFSVFMRKHESEFGKNMKWVNYRTGSKNIFFRLEANNKFCSASIEIQNKDEIIRSILFEQFLEFKALLESDLTNGLNWIELEYNTAGMPISKIEAKFQPSNMYLENQWKDIFHFFEEHITNYIRFWQDVKDVFIELEK